MTVKMRKAAFTLLTLCGTLLGTVPAMAQPPDFMQDITGETCWADRVYLHELSNLPGYGTGTVGPDMLGWGGGMGPGLRAPIWGRMTAIWTLSDLSDQQRGQVRQVYSDLHKQNRGLRDQIMDQQDKLWDLYGQEKRNASAIGDLYNKISDLRRQMIVNSIDAANRAQDVLTPKQVKEIQAMPAYHLPC